MEALTLFVKANWKHWALVVLVGAVEGAVYGIPQLQPWAPVVDKAMVVLGLGAAGALPKMTSGKDQ